MGVIPEEHLREWENVRGQEHRLGVRGLIVRDEFSRFVVYERHLPIGGSAHPVRIYPDSSDLNTLNTACIHPFSRTLLPLWHHVDVRTYTVMDMHNDDVHGEACRSTGPVGRLLGACSEEKNVGLTCSHRSTLGLLNALRPEVERMEPPPPCVPGQIRGTSTTSNPDSCVHVGVFVIETDCVSQLFLGITDSRYVKNCSSTTIILQSYLIILASESLIPSLRFHPFSPSSPCKADMHHKSAYSPSTWHSSGTPPRPPPSPTGGRPR